MVLQREKFSLTAATTIGSYSCGLAGATSFCTGVGKGVGYVPVYGIWMSVTTLELPCLKLTPNRQIDCREEMHPSH